MSRIALVFVMGLVALGGACGKTMTKDECKRVGDHIRKVWDSETEAAAPDKGPRSERASNVIKVEGERLESEWRSTCERDLEGRKVDEQEIECIMTSKTIADVQSCGVVRK